jgi:hypothetical protein
MNASAIQKSVEEMVRNMRDLLDEAIDTHIYTSDDLVPDDCAYHRAVAAADEYLAAVARQWVITISPASGGGFTYETSGPGLGVVGYEPTRERLTLILARTVGEYLPDAPALPDAPVEPQAVPTIDGEREKLDAETRLILDQAWDCGMFNGSFESAQSCFVDSGREWSPRVAFSVHRVIRGRYQLAPKKESD